ALLLTARALLTAARIRTESRGCHRRTDFPATDDVAWRRSTSLRLDVSGQLIQSGTGIARTAAGQWIWTAPARWCAPRWRTPRATGRSPTRRRPTPATPCPTRR